MAGIGGFDQTGSISDSLKSAALTYGGGQLARYVGGAGFQGNPFTQAVHSEVDLKDSNLVLVHRLEQKQV